jgi:uncharacterized membrane protein
MMRGLKASAPYLVIAALTLALMIPAMIAHPLVHDSFWIDFVWADQFTAEIRRGTLYPRWLPQSHDGLGSPVFYFYPPIGFYIAAIFGLAGSPTYTSILLAFATAMAASGAAMFHWLKGWTERPLLGACFYMAAPYHLSDFYYRGALAEYCAFALIPLTTMGIRRCAEGRGMALLTLSYAALIMTHLPVALLTSLLLIAPYSLLLARKAGVRTTLPGIALALALGIGIAAIYLVPALSLQDYIAANEIWAAPLFRTTVWNFFDPDRWTNRQAMFNIMLLTYVLAIGAAALLAKRRDGWAAMALFCCVLVTGAVPGFWSLPLLEKVQFPWRILALAEFALATALARNSSATSYRVLASVPALIVMAVMIARLDPPPGFAAEFAAKRHPDVIEYLPPGASDIRYSAKPFEATSLQRSQPPVRVDDNVTVVRTFYFPSWRAICQDREVQTFADPATRLLAYRGKDCAVSREATSAEKIGGGITLLSTMLLALFAIIRRRRSSPPELYRKIFTQS